jgi:hypothetical protein
LEAYIASANEIVIAPSYALKQLIHKECTALMTNWFPEYDFKD